MSEMVERVTAVLREKLDYSGNHGLDAWTDAARAVIEAMREPTEAMIAATTPAYLVEEHAYGSGRHATIPTLGGDFRSNWTRAVDEALKD